MSRMVGVWLAAAVLLGAAGTAAAGRPELLLATTTSVQDSGLLDVLVPRFEARTGYRVKTIAVGTGQSLAMGARGDADVVLAHAPVLERQYVEAGAFVGRRLVMHNDFVLAGPAGDPAGVRGLHRVRDVFARLAEVRAPFVSRGDRSGTHLLELTLWAKVGGPPSGPWYLQVGQGMSAALNVASEKGAYVLTDRGTYLALRRRLRLDIVFEKDRPLVNLYHVLEVNPRRFPRVNHAGARAFALFLVEAEAQGLIERFGLERYGQPLFIPAAHRSEADFDK